MKPASSAHLRWGTVPLIPADLTEPDGTHKDEGWQDTERPPHSFFNYWMNLAYLWMVYLDNITDEALTWTGAHVFNAAVGFNAGITVTGGFGVQTTGLTVAGNGHITGTLLVDDATTLSSLAITGNETIGGTLGVTGLTTLGAVLMGGLSAGATSLLSLGVTGATTIGGLLNVASTLGVTGNASFVANANVGGTLSVTGLTTLSGGIAVAGVTHAAMANSWADVDLSVYRQSGYRQLPDGTCELQGYVTGGTGSNLFTLAMPAAMRPTKALVIPVMCDTGGVPAMGSVSISSTGFIDLTLAAGRSAAYLENVRWRP